MNLRSMRHILPYLLVSLAVTSSGCSKIKLAYRYADWFIEGQIKDLTSFNSNQKKVIHEEVQKFMVWHRKEMLPKYATFLNKTSRSVGEGSVRPTVADAKAFREEFINLLIDTFKPWVEPGAKIFATLETDQINKLEAKFKDQMDARRKEWLGGSEDERLSKRSQRTSDSLEDWVGRVATEQREKVLALSRSIPYASDLWIKGRDLSQQELIASLRAKAKHEELLIKMHHWILDTRALLNAEENTRIAQFEAAVDRMIVQIVSLLSEEQKLRFRSKCASYAQDFTELSQEH